eukprot:2236077-Pleurochrysis_carterae.AAC.1
MRERSGQGADRWGQLGGRIGFGQGNGYRETRRQERSGKICAWDQKWRDSRGPSEGETNETRHEVRE